MKNQKHIRLFVVALAVLIALAFTACSAAPTTTSTSTSTTSGSNPTTAQTTATLDPYEIHAVLFSPDRADTALIEAEMNKILQEKINSTIKFTFISSANWLQQTNLMIAGNEKVDILWTSSFFGYSSAVTNGQIIAIDDLIADYGPAVVDVLGSDTLDYCKVNGKIYGVPSTRDMAADFGVSIRKDLLDKYKIDISKVKTIDDLTPVFQALKTNEPDLIPTSGYTGSNTIVGLVAKGTFDILDNWFGVIRYDDPAMQVVNLYETDEYSALLNTVRAWYTAGYISKDAATSTASPNDMLKANQLASVFHSFKPGIEQQFAAQVAHPVVSVPVTPVVQATSNITVMMASICRTTENAERAMMLLNLWYEDPALVNLFDHGIEGTHYVKVSENVIKLPADVASSNQGWPTNNYLIGNNYLSYVWEGYPTDLWEQMKEFNTTALQSPALGFSYTSETVKTELAAVSSVLLEYRSGLETGTLDPAVKLPEMIAKMKSAGMDTILADKQAQLDAWKNG